MSNPINRRRLVQVGGFGFFLASSPFGVGSSLFSSDAKKRSRYLINIQCLGGWDTSWHLSPVLHNETNGLSAQEIEADFFGVVGQARFEDQHAISFGGSYLGPAMNAFKKSELSELMILRGLQVPGSHRIGNGIIQNGHQSGYAASFSTIIADALSKAPDYPRLFHYVQCAENSNEFQSQIGFYRGSGVPINIANSTVWQQICAPDVNDPLKRDQVKQMVSKSVNDLSGMTENFKLNQSKHTFEKTFRSAFNASEKIKTANFAANPKFLATLTRYEQAVIDDLTSIIFASPAAARIKLALAKAPGFPTTTGGLPEYLLKKLGLKELVFPFALADFLITNDLAAVVDVLAPSGDYHDTNDMDFLKSSAGLACLRCLIKSLQGSVAPDESGSLLDSTLIVYSSEFDRALARTVNNPAFMSRPGTDHGQTASVILSGYGVNGGKVVGGRGSGPNGTYGGVGKGFLEPLPMDLTTGNPIATGDYASQFSILPTVLDLFGVTVPSQQKTEWGRIPVVRRPGHKT